MKKAKGYFSIRSIEYIFTPDEIMDIIMDTLEIEMGDMREFGLYEPYEGEYTLTKGQYALTIRFTGEEETT